VGDDGRDVAQAQPDRVGRDRDVVFAGAVADERIELAVEAEEAGVGEPVCWINSKPRAMLDCKRVTAATPGSLACTERSRPAP
jgi:hypothetical protein